jgi:tetratricopeptide (TPR) repeat protein
MFGRTSHSANDSRWTSIDHTSWPRLVAARGMAAITHQSSGEEIAQQIGSVLAYVRVAGETFRAAVFYYGLMEAPPKNANTPAFVARAGLDALAINRSIIAEVASDGVRAGGQNAQLGYALPIEGKSAESVRVLEYNAAQHPESANAYDSLGDAYEAMGRRDDAIAASRRALQLLDKVSPLRREGIRRSAEEKLERLQR